MLVSGYYDISNAISLVVIVTTLCVGVFASMARTESTEPVTGPRRQMRRIVVLVVGGTVLLLGVVMLVAPGPGILTMLAGLTILAAEFAWARRLLKKTKDTFGDLKARVTRRPR